MADSAVYRALRLYVYLALRPISDTFPCIHRFRIYISSILFDSSFSFSHIAPDKFYIEPRDQHSVGDQILEIDRVTQELSLAGTFTSKFSKLSRFANS